MRKCGLLLVMVITLVPLVPVLAQTGDVPLLLAQVTPQGIAFYVGTAAGDVQIVGEPLSDFAVESLGGSAEWLILQKESFAVSPDGQRIAFTARRGDEAALFIYTISNNTLSQHPISSYWLTPEWSPDSEAVLLTVWTPYWGGHPNPDDFVYEVATDSLFQITFTAGIETIFQWSADGDNIVYLGTCHPDSCGNRTDDLYQVSRDGTNRFPLTDFPAQLPPDAYRFVCYPTWSPGDQRWYYVTGCGGFLDTPYASIYSVDLNENNRLEIDLEDYLRSTEGSGITFRYAGVRDIHPRPDGVYVSLQVSFFPDTELHPDLENVIFDEWRVLRLTGQGQWDTVYTHPTMTISERSVELSGSSISPNGQYMAMLYNVDSATVINLVNGQNVREVPGESIVCDVRWLDNETLVYSFGGSECEGIKPGKPVRPQTAQAMNIVTGDVIPLITGFDGPIWLLSSP